MSKHPIHVYHMDQSWSLTSTASWQLVKEIVAGAGCDQQNLSGRRPSRRFSMWGGDQHRIVRRIHGTEHFNSAESDRSRTGKEITNPIQMRAGNIDGLRAIAMTAVVACHAGIFAIGWMGVWLFFVISGYAVTASVLARPGSFRQFGIRRLRRIAPIYWAYIMIGLIVVGGAADWRAVLGLVTFTNNLAGMFGGHYLCCGRWPTGHLWTISVEMQFYVVYGALLFLAPRRVTILALLAMLFVAPLYRLGLAAMVPGPGDWRGWLIHAGPLTQADSFAAGCLLAFAAKYSKVDLRLAGELLMIALICVVLVLLGRLIEHHVYYPLRAPFQYAAMTWFFAAVCAAALVVPWRFPRLERIGLVSYGAYMLHETLLDAVTATGLPPVAVFAISYPLVIGAAELSYRFFESRFYRSAENHQRPSRRIHHFDRPAHGNH